MTKSTKGGGKGPGKNNQGSSPQSRRSPSDSPKKPGKIPKVEMDALMAAQRKAKAFKTCRFFNSSAGCSMGATCTFTHACMECGLAHPWCDNHQ